MLNFLVSLNLHYKRSLRENTPNRPSTQDPVIDDTTPAAITLGVNAPVIETKVATRSAGTVGKVGTGNVSKWKSEDIYIFGVHAGTIKRSAAANYTDRIIDNIKVNAPSDVNSGPLTLPTGADTYFYQGEYIYEFYGYYIDDAFVDSDNDSEPDVEAATNLLSVPFKINGAQDLMIGRTDKDTDLTGHDNVPPTTLYSAYSTRREVVPNLQFKHVLSRFTFNIIPGSKNSGYLKITNIKVKSYDQGKLNIAGEYTEDLTVTKNGTKASLDLKHRVLSGEAGTAPYASNAEGDLVALGGTDAGIEFGFNPADVDGNVGVGNGDEYADFDAYWAAEAPTTASKEIGGIKAIPVGESLMVIPGEKNYEVEVDMVWGQYGTSFEEELKPFTATINIADITNPTGGERFEPGKSYDITLVIYGPEEIAISATLADWVSGGSEVIDENEDIEDYVQFSTDLVNVKAAGVTEKSLSVFASETANWSITAYSDATHDTEINNTSGWVKFNPATGTAAKTSLTVDKNTTTEARTAYVLITMTTADGATVEDELIIKQEAGVVAATEITLSPSTLEFAKDEVGTEYSRYVSVSLPEGSTSYKVTAGTPSDASETWFDFEYDTDDNEIIVWMLKKNTSGDERTVSLTVTDVTTGTPVTKTLEIKQTTRAIFPEITVADFTFASADATEATSAEITANNIDTPAYGTPEVVTGGDWITGASMDGNKLKVTAEANATGTEQTATIKIKETTESVEHIVKVTRAANE